MRMGALLLLLVAACSSPVAERAQAGQPAQAPDVAAATHPVSGLRVVPLTITGQDGRVHAFRVEVAQSDVEQAQGLMFRTQMGLDEGMIFPRNPPRIASFWMKNTVLSLDMIFIGPDGRILNISANTVPYSLESHRSAGPASAVLELVGGRAAQLGISAGDRVEWAL